MLAEDVSADGIEFTGRNARRNGMHHGLTSLRNDSAGAEESVEFFLVVNSHVAIVGRATLCGLPQGTKSWPRADASPSAEPSS